MVRERLNELKEIEITPEMIKAGIEAYCLWERGDCAEEIVESIYQSMMASRPNTYLENPLTAPMPVLLK